MTLRSAALATLLLAACGKPAAPPATAPAVTTPPIATADAQAAPPEVASSAGDAAAVAPDGLAPPDAEPADGLAATDDATPPEPEPPAVVLPPAAKSAQLSPAGVDAAHPRVSPDGRQVLFHAGPEGKRDVWVVGIDGADPRQLTNDPADDRDPTWSRDGASVIWASNRSGNYDLWRQPLAAGSTAEQLTKTPADELAPEVSPLEYTFSAVRPDPCAGTGVGAEEVDRYGKIAFTRSDGKSRVVAFRSDNGQHEGVLSAKGAQCWGPRWSDDGLSLAWTCGDPAGAGAKTVVHDTHARWDQDLGAALKAVGFDPSKDTPPKGCEAESGKAFASDACLKKLPRHYAAFAPAPVDGSDGRAAEGYATNQTLVLASGAGGAAARDRLQKDASFAALEIPGASDSDDLDWSPDGTRVVAARRATDGTHAVVVEPTHYALQDVRDLHDFPELWGALHSAKLATERFVVRPGSEKEYFAAYDKARYARRGAFVTADSLLQVVRDELAGMLKAGEERAAKSLEELTAALMQEYAKRPDSGANRYLATHFAVAWAVLKAGAGVKPPPSPEDLVAAEPGTPPPARVPTADQMKSGLDAILAQIPDPVRARASELVKMALDHAGLAKVDVPGQGAVDVDFSQMEPRGHYASGPLAGYFVAMKWLAMVPLPLDASAVELVQLMQAPRPGGGAPLIALWNQVDQLVGAFMGRPVDVTVSHLLDVLAKEPAILTPFDRPKAMAAFQARIGALGIRGLAGALAENRGETAAPRPLSFMLFPLRLGLDTTAYSALTHANVPDRGMPSAVDAMAMLGIPAALRIGAANAQGQPWEKAWTEQLAALRQKTPPASDPIWQSDLYHGWLALLATLATPSAAPEAARRAFAQSPAWADRLLAGALGGYAQLKHDSVLYAFQDYSAECDGGAPLMVYVEQPILPEPRGFVEPNPAFFRAAAALAQRGYQLLAPDGREPEIPIGNNYDEATPRTNARKVAEHLAAIAEREVAGKPLTDGDAQWLRQIGTTYEALFLGGLSASPRFGGDEGRLDRGVALVTDIHTNVTSMKALHIAIGRVDRIYVVVPDGIASHLTEGGVFSFYEFEHDAAQRMTDEAWSDALKTNTAPPRPSWTQSFLEDAPR